jgi:HD-GYP domain-containing protein (c-di-GMP phosphodiesterase class II)
MALTPFDAAATNRLERVQFALTETGVGSTSGLWFVLSTLYRHLPERLSHAQRVAKMARAIASQMGRAAGDADQIERAALAHEIGTIVVPDPALGRPLEEGEMRAKVSEQALAGARALAVTPFLEPAAAILRAMPEWIDGTGRPGGLSGDQIPMGARIVAVADVFDVMDATCQQLGWPRDLAAVELVRYAGRRFDADVVAAALRVVESVPAEADTSSVDARQIV